MKKQLLPLLCLAGLLQGTALAQTTPQQEAYLRHLQAKDSLRRSNIDDYLAKNPSAKRRFCNRKGKWLYIHHINPQTGRPVYYSVRRK